MGEGAIPVLSPGEEKFMVIDSLSEIPDNFVFKPGFYSRKHIEECGLEWVYEDQDFAVWFDPDHKGRLYLFGVLRSRQTVLDL